MSGGENFERAGVEKKRRYAAAQYNQNFTKKQPSPFHLKGV
jgi:hypothetical protein